MNFGEALVHLKEGKEVAREGWNGKGMHIYLEDMFHVLCPSPRGAMAVKREYESVICMYTAQGTHQPGWLASQADILADDWVLTQ